MHIYLCTSPPPRSSWHLETRASLEWPISTKHTLWTQDIPCVAFPWSTKTKSPKGKIRFTCFLAHFIRGFLYTAGIIICLAKYSYTLERGYTEAHKTNKYTQAQSVKQWQILWQIKIVKNFCLFLFLFMSPVLVQCNSLSEMCARSTLPYWLVQLTILPSAASYRSCT